MLTFYGPRLVLGELLALIPEEGSRLHWRTVGNYYGTSTSFEEWIALLPAETAALHSAIYNAPNGATFTWSELIALSEGESDWSWTAFLGLADPVEPDLTALLGQGWEYIAQGRSEFFTKIPIAFQWVDGSFWIVHAQDDEVRSRFLTAFGPDQGMGIWLAWRADERPSALLTDPSKRIDAPGELSS